MADNAGNESSPKLYTSALDRFMKEASITYDIFLHMQTLSSMVSSDYKSITMSHDFFQKDDNAKYLQDFKER